MFHPLRPRFARPAPPFSAPSSLGELVPIELRVTGIAHDQGTLLSALPILGRAIWPLPKGTKALRASPLLMKTDSCYLQQAVAPPPEDGREWVVGRPAIGMRAATGGELEMKRIIILAALAALFAVSAVPAQAAPDPPPPPEGWETLVRQWTFQNVNPCTGEEQPLVLDSLRYLKRHTDGFTARYYYNATFAGWSTNGWIHSWTNTLIRPDGGFVRAAQQQWFLHEDDGAGIVAIRSSDHVVILADGTEVIQDHQILELRCVMTGETWSP